MERTPGMVFYDDCFVNYTRNATRSGDDEYSEKVVNTAFRTASWQEKLVEAHDG